MVCMFAYFLLALAQQQQRISDVACKKGKKAVKLKKASSQASYILTLQQHRDS